MVSMLVGPRRSHRPTRSGTPSLGRPQCGAGGTGLVTYFDYLDRVVLAPLTSETGPFARCGPRQHTVERPLGHTPPPPEVYADPTPPATHAAPAPPSPLPSATGT